jgi:hypothetical protein
VTADVLSSPALPLLLRLEAEGFDVVANGDRLRVRPPARVTPDLLADLREHKADLLMLVRICDPGVCARRDVMRGHAAQAARPGHMPELVFRSDVVYAPGVCFSCADRLNGPRWGSCWRCMLARRLACRAPIPADLLAAYDEARICT